MNPFATAYANNDIAIISWKYYQPIEGCLGFCVKRENTVTQEVTVLPAWVGFEGGTNADWEIKDTSVWPVQKFNWKDLTAPRNQSYIYHVIPMVGTPEHLQPVADKTLHLHTKPVSLTAGDGPVKAYFNRGIVSTQFISHAIPDGPSGAPNVNKLKDHIAKQGDAIRKSLAGELIGVLPSLLDKAKNEGGMCYLALYELTDMELIDKLISNKNNIELILSNADGSKTTTGTDGKRHTKKILDGENASFRQKLIDAGVTVHNRFVPTNHIGHNKFVLLVDKDGKPTTVLAGSTNWTATGLCTQSNNVIIIEDENLAQAYSDYWDHLLADINDNASKQGVALRSFCSKRFGNGTASVWFSPNTKKAVKPAAGTVDINDDPGQPADLKEMFDAIENAEKSILFLEFQPGSPSVLDKILSVQQRKPGLFIRGAATDPSAVEDYNTALFHGNTPVPDFYNVVAASAIKDQYSYWEQELLSAGHAIIHSKIVIIDPFTANSLVFTSSHNHGYKASAFNDENLICIRGNRQIAAAYAANVIDIYDHYRWRYMLLSKGKDENGNFIAFKGLKTTPNWQDKYFGTEDTPALTHITVPHPQP